MTDAFTVPELRALVATFAERRFPKILAVIRDEVGSFADEYARGPRTRLMLIGAIVSAMQAPVQQMFDEEFRR